MWFRHRRRLAGRYELLEELGSGGTGTVYKARDRRAGGRLVAVKVLHPFLSRQSDYVARFRREAQVALTLDSRHIVQVLNYGQDDHTFFLAMEYIEGVSLDKLRKPLPEMAALRIATQVARALEEAHSKGIVHRDIKPQNVIVQPSGNVKVADLGIAREEGFGTRPMGSYHYTAPEAFRGEVDVRSDIYSLGIVLHELLTGRLPFPGDTPAEVMRQHIEETAEPLSELLPDLDPEIAALLGRCLAKAPEARPQSANEVRSVIEATVVDVQRIEGLDLRARQARHFNATASFLQWTSRMPWRALGRLSRRAVRVFSMPRRIACGQGLRLRDGIVKWLQQREKRIIKGRLRQHSSWKVRRAVLLAVPVVAAIVLGAYLSFDRFRAEPTISPGIQQPQALVTSTENWTVAGTDVAEWNGVGTAAITAHSSGGDSLLLSDQVFRNVNFSAVVSTSNREASLAVRMQDADNGYIIIYQPDGLPYRNSSEGGIWIEKRTEAVGHVLAYAHPEPFPSLGEETRLTVLTEGPRTSVYIDDILAVSVIDSTFLDGSIGLRVYGEDSLPADATFTRIEVSIPEEIKLIEPIELSDRQVVVQQSSNTSLDIGWVQVTTSMLTFAMPDSWAVQDIDLTVDEITILPTDHMFVRTDVGTLVIAIATGEVSILDYQQTLRSGGPAGTVLDLNELSSLVGETASWPSLYNMLNSITVVSPSNQREPKTTPPPTSTSVGQGAGTSVPKMTPSVTSSADNNPAATATPRPPSCVPTRASTPSPMVELLLVSPSSDSLVSGQEPITLEMLGGPLITKVEIRVNQSATVGPDSGDPPLDSFAVDRQERITFNWDTTRLMDGLHNVRFDIQTDDCFRSALQTRLVVQNAGRQPETPESTGVQYSATFPAHPTWRVTNFRWFVAANLPGAVSECDTAKPIPQYSPKTSGLCVLFDFEGASGQHTIRFLVSINGSLLFDESYDWDWSYSPKDFAKSENPPIESGTYTMQVVMDGFLIGSSSVLVP